MLIGAFVPDRIIYTAELSYPEPDFYVLVDTVITIEVEEVKACESIYDYGCSCMLGLRSIGYAVEGLDAKDLQVNALQGTTGDLILFYYPSSGVYHAAKILAEFPSGNFLVWECNFVPSTCGERIVLKTDPAIRGYLHKINLL